jgi:hypothetical protein
MKGWPADPTATLATLPPMDQLDAVFRRTGVFAAVREKVALGIVYSPAALRGDVFDLMLDHIRDGGQTYGLWRTVARLMTLRKPSRAVRLASTLLIK